MVEPLQRWGKWFLAGAIAAVFALVVVRVLDDCLGAAQPADWQVAPSADLRAASRRVPVLVRERACSSGRTAEGRIEANIAYESDVVVIDIGVRPFGGDQDCQGIPPTPFVVELAEPLGDRRVTASGGVCRDGRRQVAVAGCRRSLGEPDENAFRPADVAEPVRVLVLDHVIADERLVMASCKRSGNPTRTTARCSLRVARHRRRVPPIGRPDGIGSPERCLSEPGRRLSIGHVWRFRSVPRGPR